MRRKKLMISLAISSCTAAWLATAWSQENADRSGFGLPTDLRGSAELRDPDGRGFIDQRSQQPALSRDDEYGRRAALVPAQPMMHDGGQVSRESQSIAEQIRNLPPNHPDREAKLNELNELLKVEFDSIQEAREEELAKLENQMKKLREDHESRQQNADVIIQRRIDQLVGRPDQWGWTPPPMPFSIAHPINPPNSFGSISYPNFDQRMDQPSRTPDPRYAQPRIQARDSQALGNTMEASPIPPSQNLRLRNHRPQTSPLSSGPSSEPN